MYLSGLEGSGLRFLRLGFRVQDLGVRVWETYRELAGTRGMHDIGLHSLIPDFEGFGLKFKFRDLGVYGCGGLGILG